MRWNLVWYVPLVIVSACAAWLGLVGGLNGGYVLFTHWTWWLLMSPALGAWISSVLISVMAPLFPVFAVPRIFSSETARQRYYHAAVSIGFGIFVLAFATLLWWGSFPIEHCVEGTRLRYIPFIPWPCPE